MAYMHRRALMRRSSQSAAWTKRSGFAEMSEDRPPPVASIPGVIRTAASSAMAFWPRSFSISFS